MKTRHAAALALVGWVLIAPPMIIPPQSDRPPPIELDYSAPMSQWTRYGTFDDEHECDNGRIKLIDAAEQGKYELPGPKNLGKTDAAQSRRNLAAGSHAAQCVPADDPAIEQDNNGDQPAQNNDGGQPAENGYQPADSEQPQQN